jgi:hypothetical protein
VQLTEDQRKAVDRNLNIMRWIALGFIFFELLTLILAVLLKWVIKVGMR